jgi:hypothetical protein
MKILILSIAILVSACSTTKKNNVVINDTEKETVETKPSTEAAKDCYTDRKTTSRVNDQSVEVKEIAGTFMFVYNNTRLQPCDLPKEYKRTGVRLIVSGDVREIFPTERRAGTPFFCTEMKPEMRREH